MENKKQQIENIKQMQKEKDVVILAHYYVDGDGTGDCGLCRRFLIS